MGHFWGAQNFYLHENFCLKKQTHSINNKLYGRLGFRKFCESRVELNTKKTNKKDGIKADNSNLGMEVTRTC